MQDLHRSDADHWLPERYFSGRVTGFLNTVRALFQQDTPLKKIFYPSSLFIDELPLNMGEYATAKMAGEMLCHFLEKSNPAITIYTPRLPKTATDQTVSLLPVKAQDPVSLMLKHVRHLRDI